MSFFKISIPKPALLLWINLNDRMNILLPACQESPFLRTDLETERNKECLVEGSRAILPWKMLWIISFLQDFLGFCWIILKYPTEFRKMGETGIRICF